MSCKTSSRKTFRTKASWSNLFNWPNRLRISKTYKSKHQAILLLTHLWIRLAFQTWVAIPWLFHLQIKAPRFWLLLDLDRQRRILSLSNSELASWPIHFFKLSSKSLKLHHKSLKRAVILIKRYTHNTTAF